MKDNGQPNHNKRNIILLIVLALVCVAGVELFACRFFNPELYQRITAPVREAAGTVGGWCESAMVQLSQLRQRAGEQLAQMLAPPEPVPEEPEETQLAGEAALSTQTPISDPAVTELTAGADGDILTGGVYDVVYFNQGEDPWADAPFGRDNVGRYGCGPTAMAMVVATLTDEETDPALMAEWCAEHGYWASKSGSYLSIVNGTAAAFGLESESLSISEPEELIQEILSGKLLVALMTKGHFTNGGHFIILRGVSLTGQILVADPNSTQRSLTEWEPELILEELSRSTSSGAPLWGISVPGQGLNLEEYDAEALG